MLSKIFACFVIFCFFFVPVSSFAGEDEDFWVKPGENVYTDELRIKIQPTHHPLQISIYDGTPVTGIESIDAVSAMFGVTNIEKCSFIMQKCMDNPYADDVDRWYNVYFPSVFDVRELKSALEDCPEIEYVEWATIDKQFYVPNDPQYRVQWHLHQCGFPGAWDVSQGSEEIVIGIVDSGVDMDVEENGTQIIHEDIEDNLWFNVGEDLNGDGVYSDIDDWNGEDDDGNGYPDDFFGWDFEQRDNWPDDPWGDRNGHGTHVAGLAAAVTDNETGVAGAGFNCVMMVMGCYSLRDSNIIDHGYEGILYCAQNGADVINLSWGGDSGFNRYANDRIQFAIEEGSIMFAGCGNDSVRDYEGRRTHFYPCAYDGVIGVGATNHSDRHANFSNYGDYTDIVAPGIDMVSLWPRNAYRSTQGTSMSSPFACGTGALFLSVRPDLTWEELMWAMQRTAVDVSDLNENYPGIQYRIDADHLLHSIYPRFDLLDYSFEEVEGNGDDYIDVSEVFNVPFTIENIETYENATGTYCLLRTEDRSIRVTRDSIRIGDLDNGVEFESGEGFRIRTSYSQPHYSTLTVLINSNEGLEQSFDFTQTIGHPYYYLVDDDNSDQNNDGNKDQLDVDEYYKEDFSHRPLVHDSYDIFEQAWAPDPRVVNTFPVLVWFTGNERNALSDDDMAVLRNYLDSGTAENRVNLVLIGQFIGNDHGDTELFSDYLHVRRLEDNGEPYVSGAAGSHFADQSFLLVGGNGAGNNRSPSTMEPLEGAEAIFNYGANGDGGVAASIYRGETYSVAYLGFALEAAAGMLDTTPRHVFFETLLDHLNPVGVEDDHTPATPREYRLSSPYPNPFNAVTEVKMELPRTTELTLNVVDIYGRRAANLFDGVSPAGTRTFSWNAQEAAAGMYFIQMNWDNRSLTRKTILVK